MTLSTEKTIRIRTLVLLFFLCFLSLHFFVKYHTRPAESLARAKVGTKAGDFESKALDQQVINLEAIAQAHELTVLNFWEAWCGPCKVELPHLQELYEVYEKQGLEIIAIYQTSSADSVVKMRQEYSLAFPLIHDKDSSIAKPYEVKAVPTTIIIDKNMKILRSVQGMDMGLKGYVAGYFHRLEKRK